MITWGQKEFHSGYFEVSRSTAHITGAGALITILPEIMRLAVSRGTSLVVKPLRGGQSLVFSVDMSSGWLKAKGAYWIVLCCWLGLYHGHNLGNVLQLPNSYFTKEDISTCDIYFGFSLLQNFPVIDARERVVPLPTIFPCHYNPHGIESYFVNYIICSTTSFASICPRFVATLNIAPC